MITSQSHSAQMQNGNIANFSGHWIASEGKVSSNIGLNSKCSKVEILIEQTETEIITNLYNAECDMFGSKWGPIHQEIRGGKIFENDLEVGTITEDTLRTTAPSGAYQYAYNLRLLNSPEGKKILQSYYGTRGAVGAMAIEALHQKQ